VISRFGFAPRLPGLSTSEFLALWDVHKATSTATTGGARGYIQNRPIFDEHGRHLLPYPGFDALSETYHNDREAMLATLGHKTPERRVLKPLEQFVDNSKYFYVVGRRKLTKKAEPPPNAVKLFSFIRTHPAFDDAKALHDALLGPYAAIVARANPVRHEQFLLEPEPTIPSACHAVDVLWFRAPKEALDYLKSDIADQADRALIPLKFGVERLLAYPEVVVKPPDEE
jgi:hypothetical protein